MMRRTIYLRGKKTVRKCGICMSSAVFKVIKLSMHNNFEKKKRIYRSEKYGNVITADRAHI